MTIQPYIFGFLSLGIFYLISLWITGNKNPFAMAKGKGNDNFSASLFQMIIFTMLTIFAYTTVFAARVVEIPKGLLSELPGVPTNLLILMGISAGTAVASRAIRENQASSRVLETTDNSSLYTDRDGRTDLVKIQMLIWTFIAVVVYLLIFGRFMTEGCYLGGKEICPKALALPDIDSAFLTLMGVSQGAYVVNQFAKQPVPSVLEQPILPVTGQPVLPVSGQPVLPVGGQPILK